MVGLLQCDRKTVTQINTHYSQGMQKNIFRLAATPVNQKQETEATIHTGSSKTGNTLPGLMSHNFFSNIQMVGSELNNKSIKPTTQAGDIVG